MILEVFDNEKIERMKMDAVVMNAIYEMARDIYEGKADVNICQSKALALYGVNAGSFTNWFVPMFRYMITGKTYKASVPLALKELYIERIYQEYGDEGLRNALESYKGTIQYFEQRGTNQPGNRKIYEKYSRILHGESKGKSLFQGRLERKPVKENLEVRVFNAAGECVYKGFASSVSVRERRAYRADADKNHRVLVM
ncbi:MAG: hypothetical protein NC324_10625 [Bacteroides sp.]|nr:hypothetical protein [Bacteroides sp.]